MRLSIFIDYLGRSIKLNTDIEYVNNYTVLINDVADLEKESVVNEILQGRELSFVFGPGISEIPLSKAYLNAESIYLKYTSISSIPSYIFKDTRKLHKVTFPDTLDTISYCAFYNSSVEEIEANNLIMINNGAFYRSNLKSINITNVNDIGLYTFAFTQLTEIYINAPMVNMYALYNCSNLESLNISSQVSNLMDMAFAFTKIKNFTYPSTLASISTAFSYCLENLIIDSNVYSVSILTPHYYLKSVKFLDSYTSIDIENQPVLETIELYNESYSFATKYFTNCPKLINIINLGIENTIYQSEFESCSSLKEVNLTNAYTIQLNAFRNCINLETIIGLGSRRDVTLNGAFIGCSKLKNISYQNAYLQGLEYYAFDYSGIESYVASSFNTIPPMRGCKNLKSVDLSAISIAYIPQFCYYDCTNLKQIKFADNAKVTISAFAFANTGFEEFELKQNWLVNNFAFANCKNLQTLKFNPGVNLQYSYLGEQITEQPFICPIPIDDYMSIFGQFWGCTALSKIIIAEGLDNFNFSWINNNTITEIELEGASAYEFNDMILTKNSGMTLVGMLDDQETYTVSSTVYEILPCAFSQCQNLRNIIIPTTVKTLNATFMFCKSLESVTINSDVKTLGDMTFYGCSSLTDVTLAKPGNVQELGVKCFYNCIKLVSLPNLPSLTSIGDSCFRLCESFTGLNIDQVQHIPDSCFYKTRISSISVSSQLISIGNYSFYGTLMVSFECPENLIMIGFGAFAQCIKLSSFTFNSNVFRIMNQTFANCTSLSTISIPDNVVNISNDAFTYCTNIDISFTSGDHPCYMIDSNCFMTKSGELLFIFGKPKSTTKLSDKVTMVNKYSFNREDITTKYSHEQLIIQERRRIVEMSTTVVLNPFNSLEIPVVLFPTGQDCGQSNYYENKYTAIEEAYNIGYIVNNTLYNPKVTGGISRTDALTQTST